MQRVYRFGSVFNYAFAWPRDLDLVVPPRPAPIDAVLVLHPHGGVRASGVGAVDPAAGGPDSALVRDGQVFGNNWPRRPALWVRGNEAGLVEIDGVPGSLAQSTRLVVGGGPRVIADWRLTALDGEEGGDFHAVRPRARRARTGIGLRGDGTVIHAAATAMTLAQFAACLREFGARDAIALSAGSQAALLQHGRLLVGGRNPPVVPAALIIRSEAY